MRTEIRFLLAILLMLGVLVGTNLLFPPVVPEVEEGMEPTADSVTGAPGESETTDGVGTPPGAGGAAGAPVDTTPAPGAQQPSVGAAPEGGPVVEPGEPERIVT